MTLSVLTKRPGKPTSMEQERRPATSGAELRKGRLLNVTVCTFKLRNFEPFTEVMQRERPREVYYIHPFCLYQTERAV